MQYIAFAIYRDTKRSTLVLINQKIFKPVYQNFSKTVYQNVQKHNSIFSSNVEEYHQLALLFKYKRDASVCAG